MRTLFARSRSLAIGLAVFAALLADAGAARAEADTFGLGTGRDGALTVTSAAGLVVNTYARVTAAIAAGSSSVTVGARVGAGTTFSAGQVVMILQTHGGFATPPVSGSAAALALTSADKTGRYELARVFSVAGNVVTLTNDTVNAYDANVTQLVSVPEYTTVQINAAAKLVASVVSVPTAPSATSTPVVSQPTTRFVAALMPPPGAGFVTVMATTPAFTSCPEGTRAVSVFPFT